MATADVLVVEDDEDIAGLVALYLEREGFRVFHARDAVAALDLWSRAHPRLVVLDIGLPGATDGLELCQRFRASGATPLIFLTARSDEVDRVLGFELGADDYVTKPFSPRELVARVKAVLRRTGDQQVPAVLELPGGTIYIDVARCQVWANDELVELTAREYNLLLSLAQHAGIVLSRRQLLELAWGADWFGDERTVDVHVAQLRRKLGDALDLVTVRSFGYRLA